MHQTPADLKQRLGVFYKNLPAREYKFLISEPDFNFNTLKKLLVNNELRDFDPVKEAFKVRGENRTCLLGTQCFTPHRAQ